MSRPPVFSSAYCREWFAPIKGRVPFAEGHPPRIDRSDDGKVASLRDHLLVSDDLVLQRRRRIARLVEVGQRAGYAAFGLAIVAFVVGLFAGFGAVSGVIVALIVGGSIVLAPAIVFGYAVKAAEREDRAEGRRTMADDD